MSFRASSPSRQLLLLALITLMALSACGKKGPPMPPPKMNPAPVADLVAAERGPRLILAFTYPKTTVSGLALPGIAAVEIWLKTGLAPTTGEPKPVDPREFAAEAKRLTTLKGDDLSEAIHGDRVRITIPLNRLPAAATTPPTALPSSAPSTAPTSATSPTPTPSPALSAPAATSSAPKAEAKTAKAPEVTAPKPSAPPRPALWLAVRTVSTRGDQSPYSNQATLIPAPAPASPQDLEAKPEATGIALSWKDDAKDIRGLRVYRRLSSEHSYGLPLAMVDVGKNTYLDKSAEFGQRYTYTVVAVSAASLLVESAVGGEVEVDYQDRFPPPVPQRLVALPTAKQVRLLWEASQAEDLLGYLVERRTAGSENWERLTAKPEGSTQYDDRSVKPGASYEYRVLAVDASGNASAPSATASAKIPGS